MNKIRPVDRAYMAGFFDGEGCIYFRDDRYGRPSIIISQKDPTPLQWMHALLGFGNLYYVPRDDIWVWKIGAKRDVLRFYDVVYKHSKVKRKALRAARRAALAPPNAEHLTAWS